MISRVRLRKIYSRFRWISPALKIIITATDRPVLRFTFKDALFSAFAALWVNLRSVTALRRKIIMGFSFFKANVVENHDRGSFRGSRIRIL